MQRRYHTPQLEVAAMRAYDQGDDPGRSGQAAVWGALRSRTTRSNAPRTCESDGKGKDDAQGPTVGADHDLPARCHTLRRLLGRSDRGRAWWKRAPRG